MSDFDDDLHDESISRLYKQLPDSAPQKATDAAILSAAHSAINSAKRKPFWLVPSMGAAACLVLMFGLIQQWQGQSQGQLPAEVLIAPSNPLPVPSTTPAAEPDHKPSLANSTVQPKPKQTAQKENTDSSAQIPMAQPTPAAAPKPPAHPQATVTASATETLAPMAAPVLAEAAPMALENAPIEALAIDSLIQKESSAAQARPRAAMAKRPASTLHYRQLIGRGDYAEALTLLIQQHDKADAWYSLDRDALQLIVHGRESTLSCALTEVDELRLNACLLLQGYKADGHIAPEAVDNLRETLPAYWLALIEQFMQISRSSGEVNNAEPAIDDALAP